MKYTDLIYDFDGTIADSYPIFTESFVRLVAARGVTADYDRVMSLLKVSVSKASNAFVEPESDRNAFNQLFHDDRNNLMLEKGLPMEGAEEILGFVTENGGRNYIYTHSPNYIWDALEKWGLRKYFVGGVTADFGFPCKPAPNGMNYIIETYGIDREKCLMVGDRSIDVNAGRNAGIKGVLLDPDGFYADFEPDFRVDRLTEIKKILL